MYSFYFALGIKIAYINIFVLIKIKLKFMLIGFRIKHFTVAENYLQLESLFIVFSPSKI